MSKLSLLYGKNFKAEVENGNAISTHEQTDGLEGGSRAISNAICAAESRMIPYHPASKIPKVVFFPVGHTNIAWMNNSWVV